MSNNSPVDDDDDVELTMVDPELSSAPVGSQAQEQGASESGSTRKYERVRELGKGAMGDVFLTKDTLLRRRAALKEIKPEMAQHPQMLSRFVTEAQITAQLDHPNIVPIYDIETREDGSLAYSMKLVRGQELKELLDAIRSRYAEGKPLEDEHSLPARLEVFLKLCDAVNFAHSKGVVHRDLKPANVMIGAFGEVYLMDWGIARRMGASDAKLDESVELGGLDGTQTDPELTQAGQAIGTPRYMSPEQAAGKNNELDGRSDLFSLGLILFEIVSLRRAVAGKTTVDALTAVLAAKKEPLVHIDQKTKIPTELRAIVDKATARRPEDRYTSVEELADDVRRYLAGKAVSARPDTFLQGALRWVRHNSATAALLSMAVLLALSVSTIWSLNARKQALESRRQALEVAKLREAKLSAFQARVAARSHGIDSWLLRYEERARHLARAAAERLERGAPIEGDVFDHAAYNRGGVVGLAESPIYGKPVSFSAPVYKVSPGVDPATVEPLARKLWPLWRQMRQVFLDCRTEGGPAPTDEAAIVARLLEKGVPLRSAYLGLSEGMMFSFPGKGYDDDYDPRKRKWYMVRKDARGPGWGSPHIDIHTKQLTLTCSAPVVDSAGKRHGVLGLDVTFDYLIRSLMSVQGQLGVRETYILNADGLVVVASSDLGQVREEIAPRPFDVKNVSQRASLGHSGLHIHGALGQEEAIAFYQLQAIGHTYVVRASLESVLAGE